VTLGLVARRRACLTPGLCFRILESRKTTKACLASLPKEEARHCKEMFEKQKSIMQRVGFTDEVSQPTVLSLSFKQFKHFY